MICPPSRLGIQNPIPSLVEEQDKAVFGRGLPEQAAVKGDELGLVALLFGGGPAQGLTQAVITAPHQAKATHGLVEVVAGCGQAGVKLQVAFAPAIAGGEPLLIGL